MLRLASHNLPDERDSRAKLHHAEDIVARVLSALKLLFRKKKKKLFLNTFKWKINSALLTKSHFVIYCAASIQRYKFDIVSHRICLSLYRILSRSKGVVETRGKLIITFIWQRERDKMFQLCQYSRRNHSLFSLLSPSRQLTMRYNRRAIRVLDF